MGKLTDRQIQNFRYPADKKRHADGDGLFLEVKPTYKLWLRRYRFKKTDGTWSEKTLTLGHYPDVSLAAARRENARLKALEADGIDTAQARKEEKAARLAARKEEEQAAANTFQAIALEWMGIQKHRWRPSHEKAMRNALANNAFPFIGDRPVDQLTPPDIVEVLRAIEARGAYGMASKVLGGIQAVCRYAVQTGRAVFNPAADMGGVIVSKKVEHHKALSKEAMPVFLQALRKNGDIHPITKAAIRFTILTAARSGETRLAVWPEIDFEGALWRIPAERMKAGQPHTVPLSRQALAVLEGMKRYQRGKNAYIFPGIRQSMEGYPMSGNTMLYALYRLGYHDKATMHGFRATFDTLANEEVKGFDKDAIERALAHRERNSVRAAYHRSEYLEERRVMLQWWADWLEAMEMSGKVEPPENFLPPDWIASR